MKLALHRFDLPTRHPFTISRGTTTVQTTLIVELQQDGVRGYGEAPESAYYGATIDNMTAALQQARARIEDHRLDDPAEFFEAMGAPEPASLLAGSPFARCALDCAAHDLWGKLRGAPVWKLWGLSPDRLPPSSYTIGIDAIETMVAKLEEFPGWPVYKIKLGTADDLQIVERLRRHTDAVFRVDANGAWDVEQTLRNSAALQRLGVELIEQPLAAEDFSGMKRLAQRSALPLMADESCRAESDVDLCAGHFHGINIKLAKCGGLTPARQMIARAGQLGLDVMVGCFTESSVGISAAAQLLPLLDYADLDGALLLAEDVADGVRLQCGHISYPQENGCGIRLL